MSEERDAKQEAGERKGKGPSHIAYQVREGEDGKSFFNRVGSAFEHKDGQGFNVLLDSVPVDGRVTLRTPKERLEAMKEGGTERQDKAVYKDREEQER